MPLGQATINPRSYVKSKKGKVAFIVATSTYSFTRKYPFFLAKGDTPTQVSSYDVYHDKLAYRTNKIRAK